MESGRQFPAQEGTLCLVLCTPSTALRTPCLPCVCGPRPLTVKVDLLHDVLGLNALLLAADEDLPRLVSAPTLLAHPHLQLVVTQVSEHLSQQPEIDVLARDTHHVADKVSDNLQSLMPSRRSMISSRACQNV